MPHDAAQGRYVNPTNACQSFQPHPSTFAFSGFEGAKRHRLCRPSTGGAGGCDVPLEWLVPHDAAQGRYVNPTNACQSFQPHPSTFAFSGFEGAKRHRLCRPSGNPWAVTSTQPMPAKASSPTHPPLLLAGSKVLNGTGSADQVATRWA